MCGHAKLRPVSRRRWAARVLRFSSLRHQIKAGRWGGLGGGVWGEDGAAAPTCVKLQVGTCGIPAGPGHPCLAGITGGVN